MRNVIICLLALSLCAPFQHTLGRTTDGMTPANEGVCDELHNNTPGLYGLCVAYCEAQDLNEDTLTAGPSEYMPDEKILDAYNRRRGAGDPQMPCIQDPCPCWTQDQISAVNWSGNAGACQNTVPTSGIGKTFVLLEPGHLAGTVAGFAPNNETPPFNVCFYRDLRASPAISMQLPLTNALYAQCRAEVEQTCQDLGYPLP